MNYYTVENCQVKDLSSIFKKYFGFKTNGTFVEIGAYDGINFSNTYGLLIAGWKGLYAEPINKLYTKCKDNLKNYNAKIIRTAIGNYNGEITMTIADTISTYSDIYLNAPVWESLYKNSSIEVVPIETLDTFLFRNDIKNGFDLLTIDTEGSELEVLEGFNLNRWKPKMVIIEAQEFNPYPELTVLAPKINSYFLSYFKIYADEINSIFINKELI